MVHEKPARIGRTTDAPAPASLPSGGGSSGRFAPVLPHDDEERRPHGPLWRLALGALGVVYGDIGTSPLYAVKECFGPEHGLRVTPANVLGILSLVLWALVLVVVVKYIGYIMRAHNHGEGGALALFALVMPRNAAESARRGVNVLMLLGLFGAALLCGDGVITPAISVLSAVEGLGVATHALEPVVVPVTLAILVALFLAQRRGTGGIGAVFGPLTLLWFGMIAALGIPAILDEPRVLGAINPLHAVALLREHGLHGYLVLGSVLLVITGGEALYADMGHFGRRPIRLAWYAVVMPALMLNYLGQGALLLREGAVAHPFYALARGDLLYPVVGVATVATVIASQALISGVFSLAQQAVQLGYLPRLKIVHTSGHAEGQIYIPEVNYLLMLACLTLVLWFQKSSSLAAAYGIAVTGTMSITSVLFYRVARLRWNWSRARAGSLVALFLAVDLSFFGANLNKIAHGGWVPLVMGACVFVVMTTWKRGRRELQKAVEEATLPLDLFVADVAANPPVRVKGTAVFMTSNLEGVPLVLLHHVKHNKVLHERVVLLSVVTERVPTVPPRERVELTALGAGLYRVVAHYGFMELPDVPEIMRRAGKAGLPSRANETSFYLGRETLLTSGRSRLARWRKHLFAFLSRNSRPANAFFGLPANRVIELGAQIEL